MPKGIAINGTKLDAVHMPLKPYANGILSYLSYPMSEIRFSESDNAFCLIVPAYLGVELYRIGILPQDVNTPVEIAVGGRSVGRYMVSDVRYLDNRSDSPFGQVTFTLTRVSQGNTRSAGAQRRIHAPPAEQSTYVLDITHYLDETGEVAPLPGPARKLANFLTLLLEAATSAPTDGEHNSGIRCMTKTCKGTIRTFLPPGGKEISWLCPLCGHNGIIRNWQDTKWNQRQRRE